MLEPPATQENPAATATTDHRDPRDPPAHLAPTANRDPTATEENPADRLSRPRQRLESQEAQENPAHQVYPATLEPPARTVATATQASAVPPAHLVHLETPAQPARLATRVQPAQLASAVFAPSTAPSMVVSSSKTEPVDKRQHPEHQGKGMRYFDCISVSLLDTFDWVQLRFAMYSKACSGALLATLLRVHLQPDSVYR
jgi:hypothetical protein